MLIYNMGCAILRAVGRLQAPTVFFDSLLFRKHRFGYSVFVYVFGWGVRGAAIATV